MDLETLRTEALKLPPADREELIDDLYRSLNSSELNDVEKAWLNESMSRWEAYKKGLIPAIDGVEGDRLLDEEFK